MANTYNTGSGVSNYSVLQRVRDQKRRIDEEYEEKQRLKNRNRKEGGKLGIKVHKSLRDWQYAKLAKPNMSYLDFMKDPAIAGHYTKLGITKIVEGKADKPGMFAGYKDLGGSAIDAGGAVGDYGKAVVGTAMYRGEQGIKGAIGGVDTGLKRLKGNIQTGFKNKTMDWETLPEGMTPKEYQAQIQTAENFEDAYEKSARVDKMLEDRGPMKNVAPGKFDEISGSTGSGFKDGFLPGHSKVQYDVKQAKHAEAVANAKTHEFGNVKSIKQMKYQEKMDAINEAEGVGAYSNPNVPVKTDYPEEALYDVSADTSKFADTPTYTLPTEGPGPTLPTGKNPALVALGDKLHKQDVFSRYGADPNAVSTVDPMASSLVDPNTVGDRGHVAQPTYVKDPQAIARRKSELFYQENEGFTPDGKPIPIPTETPMHDIPGLKGKMQRIIPGGETGKSSIPNLEDLYQDELTKPAIKGSENLASVDGFISQDVTDQALDNLSENSVNLMEEADVLKGGSSLSRVAGKVGDVGGAVSLGSKIASGKYMQGDTVDVAQDLTSTAQVGGKLAQVAGKEAVGKTLGSVASKIAAPLQIALSAKTIMDKKSTNMQKTGAVMSAAGAVAMTNFWNPAGWIAGGLVVAGGLMQVFGGKAKKVRRQARAAMGYRGGSGASYL